MSPSPIRDYVKEINATHSGGASTEHSFRAALQSLLQQQLPHAHIINEPGRVVDCGAPDYVLTRDKIPLGYIEAKNTDKSLDDKAHRAQLQRYIESLDNLIFTNYIEFRFYRDGETTPVAAVAIAKVRDGEINPLPQNFTKFADLLQTFGAYEGQTITAADDLAARMAGKARLLANTIGRALKVKDQTDESRTLDAQRHAFQKILIADITVEKFADVYAQTIAYGMFAARLHDPAPADFSRHKAARLIPQSNPFLKKFFGYIADYELDERIRWIVDNLADIFRAADVEGLMKNFGKATQRTDPFIHFYETFLGKYDKKERKSRGVYYTPEPVVNFIVRAVDEILKSEFRLPDGLAATAKTTVMLEGKPNQIHKVQILDPATGTGTFLAEVVKQIHAAFATQKGAWRGYVKENLIPRLNGFEVLMAPYAMAHLKLEMILRESGCESGDDRLRVFLTNSLEKHHPDTETLFAAWLSEESRLANEIKRDVPVMVVLGNPPYSGESANKGEWIAGLLDDYKQEPGGGKLREKNAKWINDDYVKFIRYGQHLIAHTGEGILAYVNNHSFLDNSTFRGMRWSLLQSFDAIYLIDLHGNAKKKEVSPDGSPDKNVFDIQQGVSINLFVKTGEKKEGQLAGVFHHDLYGERQSKYEYLWGNDFKQVKFAELKPQAPQYFFVPMDYGLQGEYDAGFSVNELFPINSVGIVTARDGFTIYHSPQNLKTAIAGFRTMDDETAREKYSLGRDALDWKVHLARQDLEENIFADNNDKPVPINYRPFDIRYTYYTGNSKGFHCRPRGEAMWHFINGDNVGLITSRITKDAFSVLCTKHITAHKSATLYDISYIFPLYCYPEQKQTRLDGETKRKPNINPDIIKTIADKLSLRFTPEKTDDQNAFAPIDLLDYTYAVLHNPAYRKRFREFLKIDFPRVPFPRDAKQFRAFAKLGAELRALHLMESDKLNTLITTYPQTGDDIVTDIRFDAGKVWINQTQHFAKVPKAAWEFLIGGYQPAQKWLKDRNDRTLTWDEIKHYQKIIVALVETAGIMERIEKIH